MGSLLIMRLMADVTDFHLVLNKVKEFPKLVAGGTDQSTTIRYADNFAAGEPVCFLPPHSLLSNHTKCTAEFH